MKSSPEISSTRGEELRLEDRVHDHDEPRVVAQALLHDRLDRRALEPEDLRDLGEHAGPVGHLQVQVEGRGDVRTISSVGDRLGAGRGGIITLTTSPSTALAVWGPPAPGPDIVISVIASDSTVTALNGPSPRRADGRRRGTPDAPARTGRRPRARRCRSA